MGRPDDDSDREHSWSGVSEAIILVFVTRVEPGSREPNRLIDDLHN